MKTICTSFGQTIVDTMKVYDLFSKQVNQCLGDGFLTMHGRMNGAIKSAVAGTQDWWCRFSLLLGC